MVVVVVVGLINISNYSKWELACNLNQVDRLSLSLSPPNPLDNRTVVVNCPISAPSTVWNNQSQLSNLRFQKEQPSPPLPTLPPTNQIKIVFWPNNWFAIICSPFRVFQFPFLYLSRHHTAQARREIFPKVVFESHEGLHCNQWTMEPGHMFFQYFCFEIELHFVNFCCVKWTIIIGEKILFQN